MVCLVIGLAKSEKDKEMETIGNDEIDHQFGKIESNQKQQHLAAVPTEAREIDLRVWHDIGVRQVTFL